MSSGHEETRVRAARPEDAGRLRDFRCDLYSGSAEEHARELEEFFEGRRDLVVEVLVAEEAGGELVGFVELSIRPYAEGCSTDRVAYVEGWYVVPEGRGKGVGRALIEATEEWARGRGCTELASDAAADNEVSAAAHRGVGFDEVHLVRCFRKEL